MNSQELMYSVSLDGEEFKDETRLNYYLLCEKTDAGEGCAFENSFGVMIEEICRGSARKYKIDDICPVRDEVVSFIDDLQMHRVTSATLYDVAYDWISER